MKYTIEIDGIKELKDTLNKIPKLVKSNKFKQYIGENCVKVINRIASERLIMHNEYNSQNIIEILKDGVLIHNDVKNDNGTYYGLIIEYGSGTNAEIEHIGTSPKFQESDFEYWYVPEEIAPKLSNYGYKKIVTNTGEIIYMVYGQNPKHIYTDAAKEIASKLEEWAEIYIAENLDSILRS